MKPIDTAQHPVKQQTDQVFQASIREAWGVWARLMQEDYLKAAFSKREDAEAFAHKHAVGGHRDQVRKMWVVVNESLGEAYALSGSGMNPLQAVDLDFGHRVKMNQLRSDLLSRLSEEELLALGVKRS